MRDKLLIAAFGTAFGLVLSRSGAADYDYIQAMFLLTDFQLYAILAGGVVTTAIGLRLLRRRSSLRGEPIAIQAKAANRGNSVGGLLFGIGWAITGACPGPIFVNIGEGKVYALATLAGALAGAYLVGVFYAPLSRRLGLPGLPPEPAVIAGSSGD